MLVAIALFVQMLGSLVAFSPPAAAVPAATASPACWRDVTVVTAARPTAGLPQGKAVIDVSVSPSGKVTATHIAQSSGNSAFDRAAAKVAATSTYSAAVRNCKPVAGTYQFILSTSPPGM